VWISSVLSSVVHLEASVEGSDDDATRLNMLPPRRDSAATPTLHEGSRFHDECNDGVRRMRRLY
jgi:hypothetical protein